MAMKIQVEFFWVMVPFSVVVECQCFRGPCCLDLWNLGILPQ